MEDTNHRKLSQKALKSDQQEMNVINKNNNNNHNRNYWTKMNGKCKWTKYRFEYWLQSQNADHLVGIKKGVALYVRPRIRYNAHTHTQHVIHACMEKGQKDRKTATDRYANFLLTYVRPIVRSFVYSIIHSFVYFFVLNFHRSKYHSEWYEWGRLWWPCIMHYGINCLYPISWYNSDFVQFIFLWKSKCDIDSLIDVILSNVIDWSTHTRTHAPM